MAKKYSSVRPKITSPLAEIQCSLESAYLQGCENNDRQVHRWSNPNLLEKGTP